MQTNSPQAVTTASRLKTPSEPPHHLPPGAALDPSLRASRRHRMALVSTVIAHRVAPKLGERLHSLGLGHGSPRFRCSDGHIQRAIHRMEPVCRTVRDHPALTAMVVKARPNCVSGLCDRDFHHPAHYKTTLSCGCQAVYCVKAVSNGLNIGLHRCPSCGRRDVAIKRYDILDF